MFFLTENKNKRGLKMLDLTHLFCSVDDFWKSFKIHWYKKQLSNKPSRGPSCGLSMSEIMTILILFHQSNYRTFKYFYLSLYQSHRNCFPKMPCYSRFVAIQKSAFIPLFAYLHQNKGPITGISFIDSTIIKVCNIKRCSSNKVFKKIATRGKSTMGWFFGFKVHLIVNERGEIVSFLLSQGNISDISMVKSLCKKLWGKLFGDRGYISSKLFEELLAQNIQLITKIRNNMKNKIMDIKDKILLRKRAIIETINDQLKNISQIEHSRHRSPVNFLTNLLSGLIAYCHQKKKPSLKLPQMDLITC
jgi:Transposase DDE domain